MQMPLLPMFHTQEEFSLGGSLALEFVGHDHARDGGQALSSVRKNFLAACLSRRRCTKISSTFPLDRQKRFIHLPLVTRPGTAAQLMRIRLATRKERWRHSKKD